MLFRSIPLTGKLPGSPETRISFPDICKSVTEPCVLNPLLFNGHLQTIWGSARPNDHPIYYKRQIFVADGGDDGSFAVDFVVERNDDERDPELPKRTTLLDDKAFGALPSTDNNPMLVILHGVSGGSQEPFIRGMIATLIAQNGRNEKPWKACVVNSRGCGRSKLTSQLIYNGRATWDLRQTASWLREKFPNRPLFAVGMSLGANLLTNV